MMSSNRQILFNLLIIWCALVYVIPASSADEDICEKVSPCRCEFENGTGYDLQQIIKDQPYIIADGATNQTYFFHPCEDTKTFPSDFTVTGPCLVKGYSLCLFNKTDNSTKVLGHAANGDFHIKSTTEAFYIYKFNKSVVNIQLGCLNLGESYLIYQKSQEDQTDFKLLSASGCSQHLCDVSSLSTGSILIVSFLSLLFAYLAVGMAFNYFLMGARGIEIVPNLSFWRELPGLVKDGATFVQNGCKVRPSDLVTSQDSYDAI